MPVIPTFETKPGAVPSTGGSLPRANIGVPGAAAIGNTGAVVTKAGTDALQAQATTLASATQLADRAGQRLANFGDEFAQKYIEAKMNVAAADDTAALSRQLNEAEFASSKIPDRQQATDDFNARAQAIYDSYDTSNQNPLVKQHVQGRFASEKEMRLASTQRAAFNLEGQAQRAKLIDQIDQYTKSAADASDPRLRDKLIQDGMDAIDGRVAGGWMNPEAGAKAKIDFKSNVYRTVVELAMAKDMRLGIAMYNQLKPGLNAHDSGALGVMVEDRKLEIGAQSMVDKRLPVLGQYGNVSHWGGQIEGAAAQTGIRPSLIAGIASEESAGNAKALSPAGAGGPMQFMEGTAKSEGVVNRFDPNEAIPKGAEYFKKQLARFGGDEVSALAAYNWGPENVAKWRAEGADPAKLPKETQAYIASVMAKDKQFAATAASGDSLNTYRTEAAKAAQEIEADDTMDPRLKQRALALINQRARSTETVVLSQRKQADDAAETSAIGLFNGTYHDGSFKAIADQYRQTGDNSKAAIYDFLAANESGLKDFGNQPPGAQRTLAHILPGAAGKIANSILADQRTDRTEFRREAARQADLFDKGLNEGLDPAALAQNAREAAAYYAAAGDQAKAQDVVKRFQGAIAGKQLGNMPTAQAEAELRHMKEIADSSNGLDRQTQAIIDQLQRGISKNRELWTNDPIVAAEAGRYIPKLEPFNPTAGAAELQMWANKRAQQATAAQYARDPNGLVTAPSVPMFTQTEMADLKGRLKAGSVQNRQQILATLSTAMPAEQVPLVAAKIAGDDASGDAWATAMAFYKRGQPGDNAIADSLIAGANRWKEGGPEGKEKLALNPVTFSQIESQLGVSRAKMDGRDRDMQNNAIAARYVALMGNKTDTKELDTDLLNQAIKDVVGTTMTYHGAQHILPSNVQPYQFEDGVAALQQSDLPPFRPIEGRELTADQIKRYATYQTVGDGLYKVWMPDPKQGKSVELVRSDTGRPWIIDIRPLISRGAAGSMERFGVTPQGMQ